MGNATLCRWLAATALPYVLMTVLSCRPVRSVMPGPSHLSLPLVVAAATPAPPPTPTPSPTATSAAGDMHFGQATYYEATGGGACSFDPSPKDLMVAAMNSSYYDSADWCGAFVQVTGPRGQVTVRIVDLCPGCEAVGLDLDLSREAFAQIADVAQGRVSVTWRLVSPDLSGPLTYRFADGASQWWTGIQIRNHRNPVASFEYRDAGGEWISVPRTRWNYFVQVSPGMGPGPYDVRVTDIFGHVLIDRGVPLMPGGTVEGGGQFPAPDAP